MARRPASVLEGALTFLRGSVRRFLLAVLSTAAAVGQSATFDEVAAQAGTARRANRLPEAIELYRQAVQLRASWLEGWWFLGTLSYATYQYPGCETAFHEFVKLDDKRALAWSLLGLCEFETGKYDAALDHLRVSLAGKDLAPEVEAGVRFHYGLLLTRAGLFDPGKRELERYARGAAHEPMLITGLGLNALHQPMLPKDVPAERMDAVTQAGAATRSWILGEIDQAEAGFQQLVKQYPALAGVHYLCGTYLSYVRPDQAMAEFRRELELNPDNSDAGAMLALLLLNAKDLSAAAPYAKRAAAKSSDALSDYAYGQVLLGTGDLRAAIPRLEAAARLEPANLQYHAALAGAYSRAGRRADARLERRVSLDLATGVTDSVAAQTAATQTTVHPPENR